MNCYLQRYKLRQYWYKIKLHNAKLSLCSIGQLRCKATNATEDSSMNRSLLGSSPQHLPMPQTQTCSKLISLPSIANKLVVQSCPNISSTVNPACLDTSSSKSRHENIEILQNCTPNYETCTDYPQVSNPITTSSNLYAQEGREHIKNKHEKRVINTEGGLEKKGATYTNQRTYSKVDRALLHPYHISPDKHIGQPLQQLTVWNDDIHSTQRHHSLGQNTSYAPNIQKWTEPKHIQNFASNQPYFSRLYSHHSGQEIFPSLTESLYWRTDDEHFRDKTEQSIKQVQPTHVPVLAYDSNFRGTCTRKKSSSSHCSVKFDSLAPISSNRHQKHPKNAVVIQDVKYQRKMKLTKIDEIFETFVPSMRTTTIPEDFVEKLIELHKRENNFENELSSVVAHESSINSPMTKEPGTFRKDTKVLSIKDLLTHFNSLEEAFVRFGRSNEMFQDLGEEDQIELLNRNSLLFVNVSKTTTINKLHFVYFILKLTHKFYQIILFSFSSFQLVFVFKILQLRCRT